MKTAIKALLVVTTAVVLYNAIGGSADDNHSRSSGDGAGRTVTNVAERILELLEAAGGGEPETQRN